MQISPRLVAVCLVPPLLSCGVSSERRPSEPSSSAPKPSVRPDGPVELRLTFDRPPTEGIERAFDAGDGWPEAVVVESPPGTLQSVAGETGPSRAVLFPPNCIRAGACPRALVEMADDDRLDPGSGDFEYGAHVLVSADQTSAGSNIVQKGRFETPGGQWKLQVDGKEGRPSCVLQGIDGGEREAVGLVADVSIADGAWHRVRCLIQGDELTITVDETAKTVEAEVGTVDNSAELRIGASGSQRTDDQFHGTIDEVTFCVPSCE